MISRDMTTEDHETLEACDRAAKKAKLDWAAMGLSVWFASAHGPNGETVKLLDGVPYH
jgi:hypothetical protein